MCYVTPQSPLGPVGDLRVEAILPALERARRPLVEVLDVGNHITHCLRAHLAVLELLEQLLEDVSGRARVPAVLERQHRLHLGDALPPPALRARGVLLQPRLVNAELFRGLCHRHLRLGDGIGSAHEPGVCQS